MKYIVLICILTVPSFLVLQYGVMPELKKLENFYSNIEAYSNQAVSGKTAP